MALKGPRSILESSVSYFMDSTGAAGSLVVLQQAGSGSALDQGVMKVKLSSGSGDTPIGVLLNDVVNIDLTKFKLNEQKDEVQQGNKVAVMRKGWVVTNVIDSTVTPSGGEVANYKSNGEFTSTTTPGTYVTVGRFDSKKDNDGYARISVNLP